MFRFLKIYSLFVNPLKRFKDELAESPKGLPISLQSIEHVEIFSVDPNSRNIAFEHGILISPLQSSFSSVLVIRMLRKTQYFLLEDSDEASVWINSLRQAKQEAITRDMGHSQIPYPKSWSYFDKLSSELSKRKFKIKQRLERIQCREMEMSTLLNQGFNVPRASID